MKIALIGGSWSTNIGNAFFNIGAIKLLEKLEVGEVFFVPETPLWKNRELPHSSFELIGKLDVDLVILNGPCLNRRLTTIYANTFFELTQRNIPIGILSAGMSEYTDSEAQEVSDFLNQFNSHLLQLETLRLTTSSITELKLLNHRWNLYKHVSQRSSACPKINNI